MISEKQRLLLISLGFKVISKPSGVHYSTESRMIHKKESFVSPGYHTSQQVQPNVSPYNAQKKERIYQEMYLRLRPHLVKCSRKVTKKEPVMLPVNSAVSRLLLCWFSKSSVICITSTSVSQFGHAYMDNELLQRRLEAAGSLTSCVFFLSLFLQFT